MILQEITKRLERASRNGETAHLPVNLVRAFIAHRSYGMLREDATKELIASWDAEAQEPPTEPPSGTTGSNIEPSGTTGPSAGMIPPSVHAAAEARASEGARALPRRRRRAKP